MGLLSRAVDIVLYTNVWIAGAAMALYMYTRYLITGYLEIDNAALFLLANCTWLYSLHRFIGLQKIKSIDREDRFFKIKKLQTLILFVSVFAFISSVGLLFTLRKSQIIVLLIPGILSLLYVLPVFKNGNRLRDLNFVKIFVISIVWAGLTVLLPAAAHGPPTFDTLLGTLFMERFLYIFAITLPFDIRDERVDRLAGVKTIAARIGLWNTLRLSIVILTICLLLMTGLYYYQHISNLSLGAYLFTYLFTSILVSLALAQKHDWYYTGGIDGAMYLPLIFLYLLLLIQ